MNTHLDMAEANDAFAEFQTPGAIMSSLEGNLAALGLGEMDDQLGMSAPHAPSRIAHGRYGALQNNYQ